MSRTGRDGRPRLHMSPVIVGLEAAGQATISRRETACKLRNLRCDQRAVLCVSVEACIGPWLRREGTVEEVILPEAMEPLVEYDRRLVGDHSDWDDSRRAMTANRGALIRITIERAGPDRQGERDWSSEGSSPQRGSAALLWSSSLPLSRAMGAGPAHRSRHRSHPGGG